jgi:hypothetical protein
MLAVGNLMALQCGGAMHQGKFEESTERVFAFF